MAEPKSWLLLEELLERGDPAFVDELRKVHDAERLGGFASRWFADSRPWARRLLFDYLDLPLNAFRHEALVKRLFKLAEKAEDDVLLAHFLVAFDRSVRRVKSDRRRWLHGVFARREEAEAWMRQLNEAGADHVNLSELQGRFQVHAHWWGKRRRWSGRQSEVQYADSQGEAEALVAGWKKEGASSTHIHDWGGQFQVYAMLSGEFIRTRPRSTMPREKSFTFRDPRTGKPLQFSDLRIRFGLKSWPEDLAALPARLRTKLERLRLFSIHTRNYLRRRTWRYFRRLGKQQPPRYVPALVEALKLYTDEDTADGLALLDNWGLMHILFHHSPALVAKSTGWTLSPEGSLAEVKPAPIFENLWVTAPLSLLELLKNARCRPVRQWVVHLIRRDPASVLKHLALEPIEGVVSVIGFGPVGISDVINQPHRSVIVGDHERCA
jgi:hypothetical protein